MSPAERCAREIALHPGAALRTQRGRQHAVAAGALAGRGQVVPAL